jgi:hypothetical protein
MYILYIYITHNLNCHDGTVIFFIKISEFIIKLACTLFALKITKFYTYPFIYISSHHYEYFCGLTALGEDAVRANLGDCLGSDTGHFLGHEPHWA